MRDDKKVKLWGISATSAYTGVSVNKLRYWHDAHKKQQVIREKNILLPVNISGKNRKYDYKAIEKYMAIQTTQDSMSGYKNTLKEVCDLLHSCIDKINNI